jgi:ABC-type transport system involved in multi-copper enzyme maturation permease subunit
MLTTLRYVLITAVRDRLIIVLLLALVAAVGAASFLAASAIAEKREFGLAFGGELTRLILVLGMITFISFHIRRMHETREIEAILARPIARATFVLAYFVAYAGIALLLALLAPMFLWVAFSADGLGLAEWTASLVLEGFVVVAMSLFCAMTLESATASVVAGLGFYLLARSAAFFRAITENHTATFNQPLLNDVNHWVMEGIAALMPRIDLFGQSRWLVYGPGGGWGVPELLVQTAIYVPLLLLATIRDLQIKRF